MSSDIIKPRYHVTYIITSEGPETVRVRYACGGDEMGEHELTLSRTMRYVLLDAGAVMENMYLAATGLGLGVRAVGAFYDNELCRFLGIDCVEEFPVLLMLIGRGIA